MRLTAALGTRITLRNLAHGKVRTAVAVGGVCLAVALLFVQLGFFESVLLTATLVYDVLDFDLVLTAPDYVMLTQPNGFPEGRLHQARAHQDVVAASPLYVSWVRWRNPQNSFRRAVVVLGVNPHDGVSLVPELQGQFPALARADAVLVDRLSRPEVGVGEVGDVAEAGPLTLTTVGQFTLSPGFDAGMVVVSDQTFRRLFGSPTQEVSLGLLKLRAGADAARVARELQESLPPDVRVLTRPEAAFREREYWVVNTSTGIIFGCGVIVALLFGVVVTYQVLALEVSGRLPEFATLKALGFSHRYVAAVVLQKALFLAVAGYVPGFGIALLVYHLSQSVTNLPGGMTLERAAAVFVLNLAACCLSSLAALRILRRANPVDLFTA